MSYRRNPEALQPEVCEVTGRLVPADELVVAEVDGLEGAAVGKTAPWLTRARVSPSYQDLRNLGPPVYESPDLLEGGGKLWQYGEGAEAFVPEPLGLVGWYKPLTAAGLSPPWASNVSWMEFNGSTSQASGGDIFDLGAATSLTIAVRHRTTAAGQRSMVGRRGGYLSLAPGLGFASRGQVGVGAELADGANVFEAKADFSLTAAGWHRSFVRLDRSAQLLRVRTDGEWGAAVDVSLVGSPSNAEPFWVGRDGGSFRFAGDLAEIAVWYGTALTDEEIEDRENGTLPWYSGATSAWAADEGSGLVAADSIGANDLALTDVAWGSNDMTAPSGGLTSADEIPGTGHFGWSGAGGGSILLAGSAIPGGTAHLAVLGLWKRPADELEAGSGVVFQHIQTGYPRVSRHRLEPAVSSAGPPLRYDDAATGGHDVFEAVFDYRAASRAARIVSNDQVLLHRAGVTSGPTPSPGSLSVTPNSAPTGTGTIYALLVWARNEAQGPVPAKKLAEARNYLNSLRRNWPE